MIEMTDEATALERLDKWMIDDILSMSEEEIIAEVREDGKDPYEIAAKMKRIFEAAVSQHAEAPRRGPSSSSIGHQDSDRAAAGEPGDAGAIPAGQRFSTDDFPVVCDVCKRRFGEPRPDTCRCWNGLGLGLL